MSDRATDVDCAIIGGGPAGLTAAIYLARFHLRTVVIDAGGGRARMIPRTRNHAGFPDGISGDALVRRMERQARNYGATIVRATADSVSRDSERFLVSAPPRAFLARAVLIATGVINRHPPLVGATHRQALDLGVLRYCPICDGFEVTDRRLAVIGTGEHGMREALFLRSYSKHVSLIPYDRPHQLSRDQRTTLSGAGITIVEEPCRELTVDQVQRSIAACGGRLVFESVYPALGSTANADLARMVGTTVSDQGCIITDAHQRCSVPGLYAAGDIVRGLDQISHAMGEGGVAATAIRNDLNGKTPLLR